MSSMGINQEQFKQPGPYIFKINGIVHHRIGNLGHQQPKFAQIYIYDSIQQEKIRSNNHFLS